MRLFGSAILIELLVVNVTADLIWYGVSVFLVLKCREKIVASALCLIAATGAGMTAAGKHP